jgi:hypothetical protein
VRWATVKLPRRAVEKAVRCYRQDPSYLVDLCRQTVRGPARDLHPGYTRFTPEPILHLVYARVNQRGFSNY